MRMTDVEADDLSPAIPQHQIAATADLRQPLRDVVANFNAFEAMFEELQAQIVIELGEPLPKTKLVRKPSSPEPEPLGPRATPAIVRGGRRPSCD